jgi:hypothetical protein
VFRLKEVGRPSQRAEPDGHIIDALIQAVIRVEHGGTAQLNQSVLNSSL